MASAATGRFLLAVVAVCVAMGVGAMVGLGVGLVLEPDEPPAADRTPVMPDLGGDTELQVVAQGDGTTVHGPVGFRSQADIQPGDRAILYGPDGAEDLGPAQEATWSPEERPDGLYRIQIERTENDGVTVVAERTFEIRTPADPSDVAFAAAIGAAFSAVASIVGSLAVGQTGVMVQVAQESLIGFGESKLKDAEERKKAKMNIVERPRRTKAEVRRVVTISVLITVALMAVFFTFEEMDAVTGSEFMGKLPLVAPIAGAMAVMAFGSEWLLALATGTVARFKVLWSGAVTLILSSTLFRTAFGFPGYVDEDHREGEDLPAHVEGMRGVASMFAFPAILLPFVILGWQRFDIVAVAMNVGLAGLAASAMPFRPMPGNDVWRWNKLASLAFWAGAFVLFFGFELGFMSLLDFAIVGLVGLFVVAGTATWLFVRRQQPGWYLDMLATLREVANGSPAWVRSIGKGIAMANRAAEAGLGAAAAGLTSVSKRALAPVVHAKQMRELRKGIALARAAFAAAGPEVDTVSIVQSNGVGISVTREDLENALLAQQLADLLRSLPRHVERITMVDPTDGSHRIITRS